VLERLFGLTERGTTVRREVLAGAVTFLTMAYIIAVNPLILQNAGLPVPATVAMTCIAAAVPTLLMGLWANWPLALAPGMGLNALLTFNLVLGHKVSWQVGMAVVFIEGVVIALLVLAGVREKVLRGIPDSLKAGIAVGIGLFIALIGMQQAGWIVKSDATMITAGTFKDPKTLVATAGLLVTAALMLRNIPGALLLGILATTAFAGIATALGTPLLKAPTAVLAAPDLSTFGKLDIAGALTLELLAVAFAFLISDFFDTMGTVVAVGKQAGLAGKNGELPRLNRVLLVDSLAAAWGGLCSASSVTSYIESASGVAQGGRTGLTAVVAGLLFLFALFFAPLIATLPQTVTAPTLIVVGFLMLSQIREIDFNRPEEAFAAFLTLVSIPLTFSIARGIALGFLAYVLLSLLRGRAREISPLLWMVALFFAVSLAL
jgi:adenine/guanine/hypoxanthine permease